MLQEVPLESVEQEGSPRGGGGRKAYVSSQPTFHPKISEGTRQILESKRQGDVVEQLVSDASRRNK